MLGISLPNCSVRGVGCRVRSRAKETASSIFELFMPVATVLYVSAARSSANRALDDRSRRFCRCEFLTYALHFVQIISIDEETPMITTMGINPFGFRTLGPPTSSAIEISVKPPFVVIDSVPARTHPSLSTCGAPPPPATPDAVLRR